MIAGTQNPIVGKDEFYQFTDARDIFNTANATFVWYIWKKQKSGKWINITGETPKMGQKVSYNFGQKVVGTEFKLQVYKATKKVLSQEFQAKLADEIVVVPSSSHVPKITKVVLFNRGAKDPNKASYRDTLVARAYCVTMFNQEVEFHLWEDDAPGGGHHSTINKNNQLPQAFKAKVNEKGIAEVKISLLSNAAVLKAIANKYMMHGYKDEGANHEYYVTASYAGKIQKASQVNVDVANPDYKIKPKENSPKFPATSVSKTKTQADPKGEVTNAYFVNDKNEKLSRVAVGHHVKVLIKSKNLVGKYIQYVVWEQDIGWPDEIFRSGKIKIPGDLCVTGGFPITEKLFKKGIDSPFSDSDSKKQDYFLEIIVLDSTAESKKFGLDDKAGQPMEVVRSAAKVEKTKVPPSANCGEKYCIKKGDKNELIREINIRLAGFGGNVPTDEFTDRTEKMIKQFQRDYMKVPETGKVCGNVLRAIDNFQSKYTVDFAEVKCKCRKCTGFGDGSNKSKYLKGNTEAYHRYEYPGIHRSLLSSIRSVKFYLSKDGRYTFNKVNSGYRCRFHPEYLKKPTTNHMGKALDLHFNNKNGRTKEIADMEIIRKDIFNKYIGAKWDWKERNIFNLESTRVGATTWVHYDVREFDSIYLENKFFVNNLSDLNGKSIVELALELGFGNTCACWGKSTAKSQDYDTAKKDKKYKWSHTEFGNIIAKEESGDNYNICNKTKGGLKIIRDVKVVELTIKEIQQKQKERDLFAVGRYQLIPDTLIAAVKNLGLDGDDKLDEEMQDKIFDEYLIKIKRPKIIAYLEGNGTVEDAMYSSAQEWASIGVEKGKRISDKIKKDKNGKIVSRTTRYAQGGESYYANDGLNKSHISPEQIKRALINSKNANK